MIGREDRVELAAPVRGEHAQRRADAEADEHRAEAHLDRDPRAEDDAREDVAPEVVGAEQVVQRRSDVDGVVVLGERVRQRQHVGEDRGRGR